MRGSYTNEIKVRARWSGKRRGLERMPAGGSAGKPPAAGFPRQISRFAPDEVLYQPEPPPLFIGPVRIITSTYYSYLCVPLAFPSTVFFLHFLRTQYLPSTLDGSVFLLSARS